MSFPDEWIFLLERKNWQKILLTENTEEYNRRESWEPSGSDEGEEFYSPTIQ